MLRYGLIGNGRLLGGYTVPEDPNHGGLQPYPFDLTKARQLLQEAGYAAGFTLSLLVADYTASKIENILGVSLRQLGITVESKRMTMPEFLKAVYLPKFTHALPPAFDIVLFSLPVGTIFHAGMVPMALLYSKQANYSVVRDLFLDQLYEAAVRTYDPAKASTLWQKLEHYVYEQHLLLMGYQERAIFGAQQRLHFTPRVLMSFWDAYYE